MNTETITLPSGNTVVLRDPKSIKYKDRKKIYELQNGLEGQLAGVVGVEAIISVMIESWSFSNLSLPNFNLDVLGELDNLDMEALMDKATDFIPYLFPKTAELGDSKVGDATPFDSSNASPMS